MTVDMTNNRVPYGLLTDEEKAALHEHEKAGGTIEGFVTDKWEVIIRPFWHSNSVYRTVHIEKTQDVIAWEKLPDWVAWVARDADFEVLGHSLDPYNQGEIWMSYGKRRRIDDFPGIVQIGTCDWIDSKQRRPK